MDQQRQRSRCQQKLRYATGASEVHTHTHTPAPALPAHARQLGCFVQTFNLRFTLHSLLLVRKVSFQQATSDWRNTKPQLYPSTNDSQTQTLGWHTTRHVTKLCSQNTPTNAIQTNSVQIEPTAGSRKGGRKTTIFSLRWQLMEGFIPGGSSHRERLFFHPHQQSEQAWRMPGWEEDDEAVPYLLGLPPHLDSRPSTPPPSLGSLQAHAATKGEPVHTHLSPWPPDLQSN